MMQRREENRRGQFGRSPGLEDIPNIGPALAEDLRLLSIEAPLSSRAATPTSSTTALTTSPARGRTRVCLTPSSPPCGSWKAGPTYRGGSTRRNGNEKWRHEAQGASSAANRPGEQNR